ncbi:MAG: Polysaccharide deactylase family protein, PEP-CTERM locus subfamily [Candidatus Uhrbacteria bacterium GW2011_GWF2_39_13]|uniref:Polysaccharide deactylase family protein, PEP-CTERM locus subfamily n=1 Tax=Candidatus Uhrbacteria bacterium GW2011_GWF2_39_13 TaxID=1618995 RepID=A0A0G0QMT0_9BACT|nr:MAG: Polysaccharide deactylase family protein, PEP-CTERM locus subfamily [Candidatus Uhrbacteria bacterium GW2011_GWF2_39_13]
MINILTIDIEDYWSILQRDWLSIPDAKPSDAVLKNTKWYLRTFSDYNVKATFFILGEVAQSFPQLIKEIADEGHEIAVHGFYHRQIFKLSRDEFKKEISDAKKLLEDLSGQQVIGHRAPAFSINKDTQWALEVLAELGFVYDSSISPMAGKRYGWPGFKKEIHRMSLVDGQSIIEVPMSTISLGIRELGVGGGYMRHLPYFYTKWAIGHIQKNRPAMIYMHPYEIDTDAVPLKLDTLTGQGKVAALKFHKSQTRNRQTVKAKVNKLLSDFKFSTIKEILKSVC